MPITQCNLSIEMISALISAIATLIAALSAIAAFRANSQSKKQYFDSIQPQLTMSLVEYNSWLYLKIKNTGRTAAKKIQITVKSIKNNGGFDELILDDLFNSSFELYPEEIVQGKVALQGGDISHTVFPCIEMTVSYEVGAGVPKVEYSRTVTYISAYDKKISADINFDTHNIESDLNGILRSAARIANYLDGRQLAPFDTLNVLAGKPLKNDLLDVHGKEQEAIPTREETIIETLQHEQEEMEDSPDAHT